jgi:hypothetical protein
MSDAGTDRISVSRDTLRAELAALELRIVQHLEGKADRSEVKELAVLVAGKADRERVHMLESKATALDLSVQTLAVLSETVRELRHEHHGTQDRVKTLETSGSVQQGITLDRRWWVNIILGMCGVGLGYVVFAISHF